MTEGIAQIREGFAGFRATGAELTWPWWLATLAEACGQVGQLDKGLRAVEEALAAVQHNEEGHYEAEVYRLKGELLPGASSPGGGRGAFSAGPCRRPPPASEVVGTAGRYEPEPAGSIRASETRPASCWRRFTAGSPKALIPPTCRTLGRCWTSSA